MNKQMKLQLEAVVNAIVNEDTAGAKEAFHEYLRAKTQTILLGEAECDEEDMEDDKEVDEDLDKADKDVKKAKKDQEKDDKDDKKPAFLKKAKKDEKKDEDKDD